MVIRSDLPTQPGAGKGVGGVARNGAEIASDFPPNDLVFPSQTTKLPGPVIRTWAALSSIERVN